MKKEISADIFEFAVEMERDGEKLYRSLAAKSPDKGIQVIFNGLADDEVKHARIIRELQKNVSPKMAKTTILRDAKSVFAGMAVTKGFQAAGGDQLALYKMALDLEKKSREFYQAQADAAQTDSKAIFTQLAGEESQHMFLLENMIEFISRSTTWLENAEFTHLDEY
jgi:rubrerythrin